MSNWLRTAAGGLRRAANTARSYHTIQAIPREYSGHRVATRDRAQGRIPAVVFAPDYIQTLHSGGGGATSTRPTSRKHLLTTEKKQIQAIIKSVELPFFYSTKFPLQIRAGSGSSVLLESGNVLPLKIHADKETGTILNLVFVWADDGTELKVDVPVVFKGKDKCPGLKKGGHLNWIRPTLKYLCPAEHIPQKIEVDVSKLDIGDEVYMTEVDVHPLLKLLSKDDRIPICKVVATKPKVREPAVKVSELGVEVLEATL